MARATWCSTTSPTKSAATRSKSTPRTSATRCTVDLLYRVYPRSGIVEKRSVIRNQTSQPVVVESAQSGVWYVPAGEGYRLSYLTGRWAGETQLHREPVEPGKKVLESRRGNTSHQAESVVRARLSGRRG